MRPLDDRSTRPSACHARIRVERGVAREHMCTHCPCPATDWAHIHETDVRDPYNYMPLCRSCHRKYDFTDEWRARISKGMKGKNHGTKFTGMEHPQAKLCDAEVLDIRRMSQAGIRQMDIAELFGIKQAAVSKIVRRQTWSHI